jgi:hypothetical protein
MYCVGAGRIELHGLKKDAFAIYCAPIAHYDRFNLPGGRALKDWVRSAKTSGERCRESELAGWR